MLEYSYNRVFEEGTDLIDLYQNLVKDTHIRVNPLKYALITVNAAKQFAGNREELVNAVTYRSRSGN